MAGKKKPERRAASLDDILASGYRYGGTFDMPAPPPEPEPTDEPRGMARAVADTGLALGRGAVQGVRMLTDLAGADNAASGALRSVEDYIGGLRSAQAKQDEQEVARILQEAEGAGVLDQVIAGLKAFAVAPVAMAAQTLGTMVPTLVAGGGIGLLARGAVKARIMGAATARGMQTAGMVGVGAGQGVGETKGQIYDSVYQGALAQNKSEEEARALAADAQAYSRANADQLALGAGLGALAGRPLPGSLEGVIMGRAARGGLARRVGMGAVMEAVPEALQEGQQQFAGNIAQQRAGLPMDDPMAGVFAHATMAAASAAPLGGIGGIRRPTPEEVRSEKVPERGPMTRALNAAPEAAAQKLEAGLPPAVPPPPPGGGAAQAAFTAALDEERRKAEQAAQAEALFNRTYPGAAGAPAPAETPPIPAAVPPVAPPSGVVNPATGEILPDAKALAAQAREQREADRPAEPTGDVLPGDITTKAGKPFTNMQMARRALARAGEATHELARVAGGLVIRPKAAPDNVISEASAEPAAENVISQPAPEAASATSAAPAAAPAAPAPADGAATLKRAGFNENGPGPDEWVLPVSDLGDVIAKPVGEGRFEISADYMGKRLATRTVDGEPAFKAAIEEFTDKIHEGRKALARKAIADERGLPAGAPAELPMGQEPGGAQRVVQVNGQTVTLTTEQAAEWDRVGAEFKEKFDHARRVFDGAKKHGTPDDPDVGFRTAKEQYDATVKGLGMQLSAERRRIAGVQTTKEQAEAARQAAVVRAGDTVEFEADGATKRGTVTGMAYGKARVKTDDGVVTVPRAQVKKVAPEATPKAAENAAAAPVAESLAPALAEDGEGGVAPTQGGSSAAPAVEPVAAAPAAAPSDALRRKKADTPPAAIEGYTKGEGHERQQGQGQGRRRQEVLNATGEGEQSSSPGRDEKTIELRKRLSVLESLRRCVG